MFQNKELGAVEWKLSRDKNFHEFHSFVAICESFLCEFLGYAILWRSKSEQSVKVFSTNIVFSTKLQKFSPSKVSHYTLQLAPSFHFC